MSEVTYKLLISGEPLFRRIKEHRLIEFLRERVKQENPCFTGVSGLEDGDPGTDMEVYCKEFVRLCHPKDKVEIERVEVTRSTVCTFEPAADPTFLIEVLPRNYLCCIGLSSEGFNYATSLYENEAIEFKDREQAEAWLNVLGRPATIKEITC